MYKMYRTVTLVLLAFNILHLVSCDENDDTIPSEDSLPELEVRTIKHIKNCKRKAEVGDRLRVNYIGRIGPTKEGKVFADSQKDKRPYDFTLGTGQAIKAYDQGLLGMCRNEKRVLIAPPHLAYGDRGIPGVIPEKATLRFTVQLLEFLNKKKAVKEEETEKDSGAKSEL